jgi:hypothetical protein
MQTLIFHGSKSVKAAFKRELASELSSRKHKLRLLLCLRFFFTTIQAVVFIAKEAAEKKFNKYLKNERARKKERMSTGVKKEKNHRPVLSAS